MRIYSDAFVGFDEEDIIKYGNNNQPVEKEETIKVSVAGVGRTFAERLRQALGKLS